MNLLLHMCCGPCSCYPVKKLREDGIEPTGYFFNPNIHPYKEWEMRLNAAKEFAQKVEEQVRGALLGQQGGEVLEAREEPVEDIENFDSESDLAAALEDISLDE